MAVAPNLDQAAQQLADKALEKVQEKLDASIESAVSKSLDDKLDKKFEDHNTKLFEQLASEREKANPSAEQVLKSWSTVPKNSPYLPPADPKELGLRAARVVRAYAAVQGDMNAVPKFIRDTMKDKSVSLLAEKALETGTPSKGGALALEEHLAAEFYPLLRENMAVMALGARTIPMPKGVLSIAGLASGSTVGWVGEARRGSTSRPTFSRRKLISKKAYGAVAVSNDLLEESDYAVDAIIRDDLVEALGEVLFTGAVHGPGTEYAPLGIDKDPARTTVTVGSLVTADTPTQFVSSLMKAKVKFDFTSAGWLFGPDIWAAYYNLKTTTGAYHFREEMDRGTLMGYPFRVASTIEVGTDAKKMSHQFFGKWSELIVGVTREMQVEMSREASMKDADDADINAWDEDLTLVRITHKCDSLLRLSKAMAHSNDTWTGA